MKPFRPICAAALFFCLLPVLAAAQETERVHKVVPLVPGGTLSLHNFSGSVRIVGADVSDVTVDAVRTATRDRLDRIKLDIQATGSGVTIDANKKAEGWHGSSDNVVKTDFEVQVPRGASLEVDVFSSDVRVRNVSGTQRLKTFSGATTVDDAPARVSAKTFSGKVQIRLAAPAADPQLEVETFSGSIDLGLPEGSKTGLDFNSFSGKLSADVPLQLLEQRKGHLRATLNGGGQHGIDLKTFSGDVRITR